MPTSFRFSLRALILLAVVIGVICGGVIRPMMVRQSKLRHQVAKLPADTSVAYSGTLFPEVHSIWFRHSNSSSPRGFSRGDIGDTDIAYVVDAFPRLRVLNIGSNRLTDTRLSDASIDSILKLKELWHLSIDGRVTDRQLTRLSRLPELTELVLTFPSITDDGLAHLAEFPKLKTLMLVGEWSPDSLIASLAELRDLESLHVSYVGMDLAERLRLREELELRMPHCKVYVY